jgi:hypothetical protein
MITETKIEEYFTYHNPEGIDPKRFEIIRESAKKLAKDILENGGNSDEICKSIQSLRIVVYHAIASIVLP